MGGPKVDQDAEMLGSYGMRLIVWIQFDIIRSYNQQLPFFRTKRSCKFERKKRKTSAKSAKRAQIKNPSRACSFLQFGRSINGRSFGVASDQFMVWLLKKRPLLYVDLSFSFSRLVPARRTLGSKC